MKDYDEYEETSIIMLAYFNRGLPLGVFLFILFPTDPFSLLPIGIFFCAYALYQLIGYLLRFKHFYCSYQNANHEKMTPYNIDWDSVKKSDAYGIPIIFAVLGAATIVISLVLQI